MNNVWKRAASLMLSGVLLMSSLPVQVRAEEEIFEDLDSMITETQLMMDLEEELMEDPAPVDEENDDPEVKIGGVSVQEFDGNATLEDGTLTLEDADITATGDVCGIYTTIPLEIVLIGENTIEAEAVAIYAESDLAISGSGSLAVTSQYGTAVYVAGSGDMEENKKGLTIDGAQVSVATEHQQLQEEQPEPVGIDSANGVVITGAAHFKTSHSVPGTVYMLPKGYIKTTGDVFEAAQSSWTAAESGAVEFIGKEHLGDWVESNREIREHYKSCGTPDCILISGTKVEKHPASSDSRYKYIDPLHHLAMYTCCNMVGEGATPEEHELVYSAEGATIHAKCSECQEEETFTLTVQNIEVGSGASVVTFTEPNGVLSGKLTEDLIRFEDEDGHPSTEVPTEIGNYKASLSLEAENVKAEAPFSVTKIDFSKAEVILEEADEDYVYNGKAYEPGIEEVRLNDVPVDITDAVIAYSNNVAAGEATVTVTMPADSSYENAAVANFTIQAKTITGADVKLGDQLTYNGQKQAQTVVPAVEGSDVTFELADHEQTDAGTYTLTVKGTGNYVGEETLSYSIAKSSDYTDTTQKKQVIGTGVGELHLPAFTGISGEEVKGNCIYSITENNKEIVIPGSEIQERISASKEVTLRYEFTPADNSNYTGTKSGEIEITRVDLCFELEDGTAVTNENIKKPGTIQYGDSNIINTELIAKVNGVSGEKGKGFTVKYAKDSGSGTEEAKTDAPSVGSNKFWLYYSGTIDNYTFDNVLVCDGWINVSRKELTEADITKPVATVLEENEDGSPIPLLLEEHRGGTADGDGLEYRLQNSSQWKKEIPEVTEGGYYEVYYRPSDNYTPRTEGKAQILVLPYLTATYGQTFKDVEDQLPDGFSFNAIEHPDLEAKVGNAGVQKVTLDYTHPNDRNNGQLGDDYPTLTGAEDEPKATLKISPKEVTPTVTLNADVYDKNKDGYVPFSDATKNDLFVVEAEGEVLVYGTDYIISGKSATRNGLTGKHTIACKDGSNYIFSSIEKTVRLYKAAHAVLGEENFPEDTLTEYKTVERAKDALIDKIEEDAYPEDQMKFFKVYMTQQVGAELKDNQWEEYTADDAFPPAGLTYEIPYSDLSNATEKDSFKVALLYLAGEDAGKIKQVEAGLTTTGLKINLKREAIVCIAAEVDLTEEYEITKSIVLDSKTSTKGTLTIKVDDKTATKATYGTTVSVTATAKSGYSVEKVTVTDASGSVVELEKKSEGSYEFKMPASKVTVKLSLKKTTSSTKNPSSGDNSNIQLWTTILAASGVAIVAVFVFWLRRRKK